MKRIYELIDMVKEAHPKDCFFDTLNEILESNYQALKSYQAYNQALNHLDPISWQVLSQKAVTHFIDHRRGQRKQGFFNQLNEAFAYQFLVEQGYTNVAVLSENGETIPDLSFQIDSKHFYCEVKTIGVSDDELNRFENEQVFDASIYNELSAGFMNKLSSDLDEAHTQIVSQGNNGIIFIIIHFDDFTLSYYERYKQQIQQCISSHKAPEIFIKVGLIGKMHIHKTRDIS